MGEEDKDYLDYLKFKKANDKPKEEKPLTVDLNTVYKGTKDKGLTVHIMSNEGKKEVAIIKKKVYDLDCDWGSRSYAIESSKFITDIEGHAHYFTDVNDLTGGLRLGKCHAEDASVDALSGKLTTQRRNIKPLWGIDNIPLLMVLIMGIGLVIVIVAVFYIYSDDQATHKTLETFLPKNPAGSTGHFLIGGIILNGR